MTRKPGRRAGRRRRWRWPSLILLPLPVYGLVALVLLPLALVPKRTDVAMKILTSEVRFQPTGNAALLFDLRIRSFVVQVGHRVLLGEGCVRIGGQAAPCSPLHVLAAGLGRQMTVTPVTGTMTINRLTAPTGAHVSLRALDGPPSLVQVKMDGAAVDIPFAHDQELRLACDKCWRDRNGKLVSEASFRPDKPQLGHIQVDTGRLSLTLEPADASLVDSDHDAELELRHLTFTRSVDGLPRSAVRRAEVTSLTGGGSEQTWKSKSLRLSPEDRFALSALTLAPNELGLSVTGKDVSGLYTEQGDRTPSLLDWATNNRSWAIYLNAIAAIGSVILSVFTLLLKAGSGFSKDKDPT